MSAVDAAMGVYTHVFHAEPAPTAHSLMPSPLLLTQTGNNPIGVRGRGGTPTLVAEFPREKKLGCSPDWARDVRGLLEVTVLPLGGHADNRPSKEATDSQGRQGPLPTPPAPPR